ncbi:MAG: putative glycolipid-binding domain-containing protein [Thermaerobacter sp.]|nr:putative glycolipid-binding domain-containing protein [Thermaerobacter sp.]
MDVLWERLGEVGQEVCTINSQDALVLTGTVVTAFDGQPASVCYVAKADESSGVTRMADVTMQWTGKMRTLSLRHDANGRWWVNDHHEPTLDGLDDVDLGVTPATNTLPIRRLGLAVGQSTSMTAAWVRFPALTVTPLAQRYTRQARDRYVYQSLASGYQALLTVDADGVVQSYEGVWRRVSLGPAVPRDPVITPLSPRDFDEIAGSVDSWWGRPVADLLHRFMFAHFCDTSFVVHVDGRPVAFLLGFVSPAHPDEAYVHMLGVDPAHRGEGLGRRLYEAFFALVRQRGVVRVRAVTSPINGASIAFHRAVGFTLEPGDRVVDGNPVHSGHDGPGVDRVAFVRQLD